MVLGRLAGLDGTQPKRLIFERRIEELLFRDLQKASTFRRHLLHASVEHPLDLLDGKISGGPHFRAFAVMMLRDVAAYPLGVSDLEQFPYESTHPGRDGESIAIAD